MTAEDYEIEITSEMIEAGAVCLYGYDDQVDSAPEKAAEIFREMSAARGLGQRPEGQSAQAPSRLALLYSGSPSLRTELIVEKLPVVGHAQP